MDWNEFIKKINDLFMQYSYTMGLKSSDESLEFSLGGYDIKYTREEFNLIRALAEKCEYNKFTIKGKATYEAVLYEPRHNISSFDEIEKIGFLHTLDDNLSYEVSEISDHMLYYILKNMNSSKYVFTYHFDRFTYYKFRNGNFLTMLKIFMNLPYSIKLMYDTELSEDKLINIIKSYLFDISMNYNSVFRLASDEEEVLGKSSIYYKINKITPIKSASNKIYKTAILDQYSMAMANEDPMMQFIGYYHIIEYFFNIVFFEDAYNKLRNIINKEEFTYNNNNDLLEIIKFINKKFKGSMRVPEGEALLLTLKKSVDIDELKDRLDFISSPKIKNFKLKEVSFSKGNEVDLNSKNEDDIYINLKDRIYKTRNAIVHSKANDKEEEESNVYNPFENEEELRKEIPLMRAIAEQIIIKTAEEL